MQIGGALCFGLFSVAASHPTTMREDVARVCGESVVPPSNSGIEPSRYVPPGAKRLRESFGRAARGAITTPGVAPHKFRSVRARPAVEASLERWFAAKCSTPSVRSEGLDSYALQSWGHYA